MLIRIDYDPPGPPSVPYFFHDGEYSPTLVVSEHQQKNKKLWIGTASASLLKSISYVPGIPEMDDYHQLADKMYRQIPGRWQRGLDNDRMPRLSEFWASQQNHIVNPLILGQRPQADITVSTIDSYEVLRIANMGVNNQATITLDNATPLHDWANGALSCGPFSVGAPIFNLYGEECGTIVSFPNQNQIELDRSVTFAPNAELRPSPWIRKMLSFGNWYVNQCGGCNRSFSDIIQEVYPVQYPDQNSVDLAFPIDGPYGDKCPSCYWEISVPGAGGLPISPHPIHVVDGQHRLEGTQRGICGETELPAGGTLACNHALGFTIMPAEEFNESLQKRIFMEITTEGVDLAPLHKMLMYYLIGSRGSLPSLDTDSLGSADITVDLSAGTNDDYAYKMALSLVGTGGGVPDVSPLSGLAPPFRGIQGRVRVSSFGFLWAVIKGYTGAGGILNGLGTFADTRDSIDAFYCAIRGFTVPTPAGGGNIFQGWGVSRSGISPSGARYWNARPSARGIRNDYLGIPWDNNVNQGIISSSGGGAVSKWHRILFQSLFPDIFELASAIVSPPTKTEYMRVMWGATGNPGAVSGEGLYSCNLEGAATLWETPAPNQWSWQAAIMRDQLYRTQGAGRPSAITDDLATPYARANPTIAAILAAGSIPSINDYMLLPPCVDNVSFRPTNPGPLANAANECKLVANTDLSFYMPLNCIRMRVEFYQNNEPVIVAGTAVIQEIQANNRRMEYPARNSSGNLVAGWGGPRSGIQTIQLRDGINYNSADGDLLIKIIAVNDNDTRTLRYTVEM